MATNPRLPENKRDDLNARLRENQPKSGAPWVLIALIVAAAILVALIAFLPRAPKASAPPAAAQVPPQPTGGQIELSHVKIVPAPTGNAIAIEALMSNAGNTTVNGVGVDGQFMGQNGQVLATVRSKVMEIKPGTGNQIEDLTQAPIAPGTSRPVRMMFDNVPQGWNHEVPGLTVAVVTAIGNPGAVSEQNNSGNNAANSAPNANSSADQSVKTGGTPRNETTAKPKQ